MDQDESLLIAELADMNYYLATLTRAIRIIIKKTPDPAAVVAVDLMNLLADMEETLAKKAQLMEEVGRG